MSLMYYGHPVSQPHHLYLTHTWLFITQGPPCKPLCWQHPRHSHHSQATRSRALGWAPHSEPVTSYMRAKILRASTPAASSRPSATSTILSTSARRSALAGSSPIGLCGSCAPQPAPAQHTRMQKSTGEERRSRSSPRAHAQVKQWGRLRLPWLGMAASTRQHQQCIPMTCSSVQQVGHLRTACDIPYQSPGQTAR